MTMAAAAQTAHALVLRHSLPRNGQHMATAITAQLGHSGRHLQASRIKQPQGGIRSGFLHQPACASQHGERQREYLPCLGGNKHMLATQHLLQPVHGPGITLVMHQGFKVGGHIAQRDRRRRTLTATKARHPGQAVDQEFLALVIQVTIKHGIINGADLTEVL